MMRALRSSAPALCSLALLALGDAPARGDIVATASSTVVAQAGNFLYTYTVSVASSSTVGMAEFGVTVDPGANINVNSFANPSGFFALYTPGDTTMNIPGDPSVQFFSTDPSTDIAPGKSGIFSFTSPFGPTAQPLLFLGQDASGNFFEAGGSALAPVPEPSSVTLLGLGVAAVVGAGVRSRRRSAPGEGPGRASRRPVLAVVAAALAAMVLAPAAVRASDHADTAANFNRIGADMTDVFIFPSPVNNKNVVLVMDVHGLIPAGQGPNVYFDPGVLYQIKIDTTGDFIEDLVIQTRFMGTGPNQQVIVSGPAKPATAGTSSIFGRPYPTVGKINTAFTPVAGMQMFAGVRSEPFFFDLNRFFQLLPDRMTPLTGQQVNFPSILAADSPTSLIGFRGFPAGSGFDSTPAMDFFANLNVLSIIVELPRAALGGGMIRVWETTSLPQGFLFQQQDRLARPAINEVLATVTALRHQVNNMVNPTDDPSQLKGDILTFMTNPAGANRSPAIANALASVLVPDVMVADLSNMTDKASYLGVETGGFTGGKFGGRALTDDVVDIDLMAIFGPVIPKLMPMIPDDGEEKPQFETDNVGPHSDYLSVFPYLGVPH